MDARDRRLRRELTTLRLLIGLYCRRRHGGRGGLCDDCRSLWEYARARVERCPFGGGKPTCARCRVHCFQPARREEIRRVMRAAGPGMAWRHPLLSLRHLLDGRRGHAAKGEGRA